MSYKDNKQEVETVKESRIVGKFYWGFGRWHIYQWQR